MRGVSRRRRVEPFPAAARGGRRRLRAGAGRMGAGGGRRQSLVRARGVRRWGNQSCACSSFGRRSQRSASAGACWRKSSGMGGGRRRWLEEGSPQRGRTERTSGSCGGPDSRSVGKMTLRVRRRRRGFRRRRGASIHSRRRGGWGRGVGEVAVPRPARRRHGLPRSGVPAVARPRRHGRKQRNLVMIFSSAHPDRVVD